MKYLKGTTPVSNLLLSMKAFTVHSRLFEEYRVKESLQILLCPQTTHTMVGQRFNFIGFLYHLLGWSHESHVGQSVIQTRN